MQDSGLPYSCLSQNLSNDDWIENNFEGRMKTFKESSVTTNLVSFKTTISLQTPSAVIFNNSSEKRYFVYVLLDLGFPQTFILQLTANNLNLTPISRILCP